MSTYSRPQLWLGLLRPKTLFSGLSSVLVAIGYAYSQSHSSWLISVLLILLAVSAQIASNIANDLIDYKRGADTEYRTGPLRPLSKGLISLREVRAALAVSLVVLLTCGLSLIAMSSWWLLLVGLAIVLGIFAYSGGPYPLSYNGFGEVAVLIFFGWVPVVTSYYILGGDPLDSTLWHLATAIGLASANILLVNNYRDYAEDSQTGKRTIVVRFGRDFAPRLYMTNGLLAMGLLYPLFSTWSWVLLQIYILSFLQAHRSLQRSEGEALNRTLALTARNVFVLALIILGLLWLRPV
ncbi:1,4-dihydroxy-2-naphthoate octaprenyltransferase [Porphyromonas sp. COT-290 OH860]|uniref:1,4-dihydroxy-2-naphthoate octaprenyltransferase n=1 Tax=Porphyromonas sp. COT-290 OH860 TaxID=1515615 RepID=UPI00052D501A|nr:1,4-dihydroxy-2-naphthoate octaprenyltransferase [Porphyromonas sp. COT-290 OH860]KGN85023.1 1,4-dihydroxy-2-naphthoate prenyltransferase [Porphyromonas sp. COT-290 OH860]